MTKVNKTLAILIASHIATIPRLSRFKRLLQEIKDQTTQCKVYISISISESIKPVFFKMFNIDDTTKDIIQDNVKMFINPPQAQFIHYKFLSLQEEIKAKWVIFSDDDDTWHKDRNKEFLSAINRAQDPIYFINLDNHDSDDASYLYHHYCIRMQAFKQFINETSENVLKCYLADAFFVRYAKTYYLRTNEENGALLMLTINKKLYIYDIHNDSITNNDEAKFNSLSHLATLWRDTKDKLTEEMYLIGIQNIILSCLEFEKCSYTRINKVMMHVYKRYGINANTKRNKNEVNNIIAFYERLKSKGYLNEFTQQGFYL